MGYDWHGMGLYFDSNEERQRTFTSLCEFFTDLVSTATNQIKSICDPISARAVWR